MRTVASPRCPVTQKPFFPREKIQRGALSAKIAFFSGQPPALEDSFKSFTLCLTRLNKRTPVANPLLSPPDSARKFKMQTFYVKGFAITIKIIPLGRSSALEANWISGDSRHGVRSKNGRLNQPMCRGIGAGGRAGARADVDFPIARTALRASLA
jgi:hypothetical protein